MSAPLLLASGSPRRRDLLAAAGVRFDVFAAHTAEHPPAGWSGRDLCLANAAHKAEAAAEVHPGRIVLGADTIVVMNERIYEKPAGLDEAARMLEELCGHVHEVLTGVCLLHRVTARRCLFRESTRVKFRLRADVDIAAYLASIDPLDKAGAYSAQEDGGRLIESVEGSRANVVGLPIERVLEALRTHFPEVL